MSERGPFKQAGTVSAEAGVVIIDGPDGVALSLTPDAAEELANRLVAAAAEARGQSPGDDIDQDE